MTKQTVTSTSKSSLVKKKVYMNHDGNIDDLVSLFLLLQIDSIDLIGVSVIDADSYMEPAVSASRKIIDRFGKGLKIDVSPSTSRGKNPFPREWRLQPYSLDALPVLNESGEIITPIAKKPAHQHLIDHLLESTEPITLLFTGPLTDLARALDQQPEIEKKINSLYWMGGTFLEVGNVEEPDHDGTAEWNAYWDPEAVARVWASKIEIHMVALESTNKVPLDTATRNSWARGRSHIGLDFMAQCYAICPALAYFATNETYYLWDVLTIAALGKPDLVKSKRLHSIVHTNGPSQGKTEEAETGRPVHVVYDVDREGFFAYITDLAKKVQE